MTKWLDRLAEIQKAPSETLTKLTNLKSVSFVSCESEAFQNFEARKETPKNEKAPTCHLTKLTNLPAFLPTVESARAEYRRRRQMGYGESQAHRWAYGAAVDDWLRANWSTPTTGQCAGCGGTLGPADNLHLKDGARLHTDDDNACLIAYGRKRHLAAAEALAGLGIKPPPGWLEEWEISK